MLLKVVEGYGLLVVEVAVIAHVCVDDAIFFKCNLKFVMFWKLVSCFLQGSQGSLVPAGGGSVLSVDYRDSLSVGLPHLRVVLQDASF